MARTNSLEARISKLEKTNSTPTALVVVRDGETLEQAAKRTGLEGSNMRPIFIVDEFPE